MSYDLIITFNGFKTTNSLFGLYLQGLTLDICAIATTPNKLINANFNKEG
jgi:hypothetical protein